MTALHLAAVVAAGILASTAVATAATAPETKNAPDVRIIGLRGAGADSLERVGLRAYSDGGYEDAEGAFRDAITSHAHDEGDEKKRDANLAQLHSNLAWLYHEMHRDAEADSVLRRAIELDRKADGEHGMAAARRTAELAMLNQASGRYQESGKLFDEAIELFAKNPKSEPRDVAFTLQLLARNYHATGDATQSESTYRRVLASLDENETMDASLWATTMLDLAELYHATHRDREAREAFEKALKRANDLYTAGGLSNALVLDPYSVLQRRAETVGAMRDSSPN